MSCGNVLDKLTNMIFAETGMRLQIDKLKHKTDWQMYLFQKYFSNDSRCRNMLVINVRYIHWRQVHKYIDLHIDGISTAYTFQIW